MTQLPACLPPGTEPALGEAEAERYAVLLRALADPVRLRILSLLAESPSGEVCACDFVAPLGRAQPTISHHLKVLRDAAVVEARKQSTWVWYSLNEATLGEIERVLGWAPTLRARRTQAAARVGAESLLAR